jgi:hypothetical protein
MPLNAISSSPTARPHLDAPPKMKIVTCGCDGHNKHAAPAENHQCGVLTDRRFVVGNLPRLLRASQQKITGRSRGPSVRMVESARMAKMPGKLMVDLHPNGTVRLVFLPSEPLANASPIQAKNLDSAEVLFNTCGL